jgi:AcrR family transcriptional regulator
VQNGSDREVSAKSGSNQVHDVRMVEIREAALTLFSNRGYHGTSMEDIAFLVGLGASSLYNHVSSKQSLLAQIMLDTMNELLINFDQATASGTTSENLRAAMESHVRYHATHQRDVRIGNREIPSLDEPVHGEVVSLRRVYAHRWQQLISVGVEEGVFATPSTQLAAYALLEMGIGVSQWYHSDGRLTLDEIASHYGEMALQQLLVRSDGGSATN